MNGQDERIEKIKNLLKNKIDLIFNEFKKIRGNQKKEIRELLFEELEKFIKIEIGEQIKNSFDDECKNKIQQITGELIQVCSTYKEMNKTI